MLARPVLGNPFRAGRAGKPCIEAKHLVSDEGARVRRRWVAGEIPGRGVERALELADLARDQTFVGDRAHPHGKLGFAFVQIDGSAAALEFERDLWVLAPELYEMWRQSFTNPVGTATRTRAVCETAWFCSSAAERSTVSA